MDFICNPSNCECECGKAFDVGEYQTMKIVRTEKK